MSLFGPFSRHYYFFSACVAAYDLHKSFRFVIMVKITGHKWFPVHFKHFLANICHIFNVFRKISNSWSDLHRHSESLFDKPHDFLLVLHCYYASILYRFQDIATVTWPWPRPLWGIVGLSSPASKIRRVPKIKNNGQVMLTPPQTCSRGIRRYRRINIALHSTAQKFTNNTRMWANTQRDIRPAEYRWRPLFNAAKYGWHQLLECRAVTL